jgi:hypothetical protein
MLTLFLFSGYVALAPARWLIKTHLEGFSNHYQTYVWIAFLLTGIWLVYTVAEHSGRLVVSGFQRHNHKQGMRKYLETIRYQFCFDTFRRDAVRSSKIPRTERLEIWRTEAFSIGLLNWGR